MDKELLLQALTRYMSEAIYILDNNIRLVYINDAAKQLLGLTQTPPP